MAHFLWRVEGSSITPDHMGWQQGLTLHLRFQPLTHIIARRDGCIRSYLALAGCPRCRPDGCDCMCHRMLFAQLIRTTLPGIMLIPTPRLIPRATETQRLVALPHRHDARLLDAAFLAQWTEGRLITTWTGLHTNPQHLRVGALLAVGQEGPDPDQALRAAGWRVSPLATLINHAAFTETLPGGVHVGRQVSAGLREALHTPTWLTGAQTMAASGR